MSLQQSAGERHAWEWLPFARYGAARRRRLKAKAGVTIRVPMLSWWVCMWDGGNGERLALWVDGQLVGLASPGQRMS